MVDVLTTHAPETHWLRATIEDIGLFILAVETEFFNQREADVVISRLVWKGSLQQCGACEVISVVLKQDRDSQRGVLRTPQSVDVERSDRHGFF